MSEWGCSACRAHAHSENTAGDGKAYLCAEGLFRCTITTTTTDIRNPWYLVDVDFESTQGKKGKGALFECA